MKRRNPQLIKISVTAIMMALSIIMNQFLSTYITIGGTRLVEIGFHTVPVLVVSLVCGPFYGAICGCGADLIPALLFPVGPFFPGFTINATIYGALPGLFLKISKGNDFRELFLGLLIVMTSAIGLFFVIPFLENFKIGQLEVELNIAIRVLICVLYFLLASGVMVGIFFLQKLRKKRKDAFFTPMDCILGYYVRDLLLRPYLAPIWLLTQYSIPYQVTYLTQLVSCFIVLPILAAVLFFVLYPVSLVFKGEIQDTYRVQEKTYSKLLKGKSLSNPFLFI